MAARHWRSPEQELEARKRRAVEAASEELVTDGRVGRARRDEIASLKTRIAEEQARPGKRPSQGRVRAR